MGTADHLIHLTVAHMINGTTVLSSSTNCSVSETTQQHC